MHPLWSVCVRPFPGEFIRAEILKELGLSVSRAAEQLGVRRAALSDLVDGKAGLSTEMALRVEKACGVSMDTLPHMPTRRDSYTMRQRTGNSSAARITTEGRP